jgi:hypothetical protein
MKNQVLFVVTTLFCAVYPAFASIDYSCVHSTAWVINNDDHTNAYFSDAITDATSSSLSSSQWAVKTNRIPNYDHTFTSPEISTLYSRPTASTDFTTGATTATVGEDVVWGQNIGYSGTGCSLKYWPPGPDCPTAVSETYDFTLSPAPETSSSGNHSVQLFVSI